MDPTTEPLSDYACRLTYEDLSPEAIEQVKRTLVDSSEWPVVGSTASRPPGENA